MSATKFLNVDLDIRSQSGLDDFLNVLKPSVIVLNASEYEASLELNADHSSLDETLIKFAGLIESLPPKAKSVWDQCELRSMNIGIQGGSEPHQQCFIISEKAVSALAGIRSEVVITVYACPNENEK